MRVEFRSTDPDSMKDNVFKLIGKDWMLVTAGTKDSYNTMMYERLTLMKELLKESGAIFVHCDWRVASSMRLILDDIFSTEFFGLGVLVSSCRKLSGMFCVSDCFKVGNRVVCSISVFMMDVIAFSYLSIVIFPDDNMHEFPVAFGSTIIPCIA